MSGFGITAIMGLTLPILQPPLGIGPNFGLRLDTPISFTLVGKEVKVGTDFYSSIMSSDNSPWYTTTNIVGNISISPFYQMNNKHLSAMEIISGLGLTSASISKNQTTTISIHADINYYLPMDLSGFKIGFNLHNQLTLGHPKQNSTTSIINANLLIKTPLQF